MQQLLVHSCTQSNKHILRLTWHAQVWYAFSGNGSQWAKMGLTLLQNNKVFAKAIHECASVLKPFGVDLIATFGSDKGYHNPTLMSVGLIAVQIALVDVLREEYGITPAGMLGHSAGASLAPAGALCSSLALGWLSQLGSRLQPARQCCKPRP